MTLNLFKYVPEELTQKEINDLKEAIANNVPINECDIDWWNNHAKLLAGLRRGYQKRFISEAYTNGPLDL